MTNTKLIDEKSQLDLDEVKNQVKGALIENLKKKKRGGKKHKKDKKEYQEIVQIQNKTFESNKKNNKPDTYISTSPNNLS